MFAAFSTSKTVKLNLALIVHPPQKKIPADKNNSKIPLEETKNNTKQHISGLIYFKFKRKLANEEFVERKI